MKTQTKKLDFGKKSIIELNSSESSMVKGGTISFVPLPNPVSKTIPVPIPQPTTDTNYYI